MTRLSRLVDPTRRLRVGEEHCYRRFLGIVLHAGNIRGEPGWCHILLQDSSTMIKSPFNQFNELHFEVWFKI
jgi:hypothetical protein